MAAALNRQATQGQLSSTISYQQSIENKLSKIVTFHAPKMVVIEDVWIGLLHRVMQLLFLIVILSDVIENHKYLMYKPLSGQVAFWAEQGNMTSEQRARAIDTSTLCDNRTLWYFSGSRLGKYAWSKCENRAYSELHEKGEGEFFVMTSYIDITTATQDCTLAGASCKPDGTNILAQVHDLDASKTFSRASGDIQFDQAAKAECSCLKDAAPWYDDFRGKTTATSSETQDQCTCLRRQHVYTPGVEEMTIVLEPSMNAEWESGFGVCSGNFRVDRPRMEVRGSGEFADRTYQDCNKDTSEGKSCKIPVRELLRLAGIDKLDDPVAAAQQGQDYRSQVVDVNGLKRVNYNSVCGYDGRYVTARPSFCVGEWLASSPDSPPSGVDSDAYTAAKAMPGDRGRLPTYRQTGLTIELDIRFSHDCADGNAATAYLVVRDSGIVWNSKGSKVDYDEWGDRKYNVPWDHNDNAGGGSTQAAKGCTCKATDAQCRCEKYRDRYRFGLKNKFLVTGRTSRLDPGYILEKIGEVFLFVLISSTLVSIVAFYLIPTRSKFYRTRRTEKVNADVVNARIAAQTAINALAFRSLDGDGDGVVSKAELAAVFVQSNPTLTTDQANSMASHILKVADEKCTGTLSFNEFVKCVSDDPKSLDLMYSTVARPSFDAFSAGVSQRLEEPYQMWEQRSTADGKIYFANHETRVTTWVDPRPAKRGGPRVVPMVQPQQQVMVLAAGGQQQALQWPQQQQQQGQAQMQMQAQQQQQVQMAIVQASQQANA